MHSWTLDSMLRFEVDIFSSCEFILGSKLFLLLLLIFRWIYFLAYFKGIFYPVAVKVKDVLDNTQRLLGVITFKEARGIYRQECCDKRTKV